MGVLRGVLGVVERCGGGYGEVLLGCVEKCCGGCGKVS